MRASLLFSALLAILLSPAAAHHHPPATPAEAKKFIEKAEELLEEKSRLAAHASWIQSTYIIHDTERLAAEANREYAAAVAKLAAESRRFDALELPAEVRRKLELLRLAVSAPVPSDPAEQREMAEIQVWMESAYGKGKHCSGGECRTLQDLEEVLRESRDPKELIEAWRGWRTVSPPMRRKYARFVELANKGAREMGFADVGALWRSNYDMPPEAFSAELDRLWEQVRPLYDSLHTYVRARLVERYGEKAVGSDGLIPAHLLGNMWAQSWDNVYPLVAPPASDPGYDLTERLKARKTGEVEMVRTAERFFTSLGLKALPKTFWERSLFVKPRDREVVCHASAWDVESPQDLRIKMCIKVNADDFTTIHHELGHNYYQRAYGKQPFLFRGSANDGFHEALGDTVALAVTPEYLKKIGLLDKVPGPEGDLGLLMKMALERVAFLPFGLVVDQWRFKVFSGEVAPKDYNKAWWALREKYQKVKAPAARSAKDFDPGAKYHVPANVPYTRYFLAHLLEFQLYRDLCREAGQTGPLHRCTFYGDKRAGRKLRKMMEMGRSRPWPEALKAATGSSEMDASAVLDYFAPLKAWLDEQNARLAAGKSGGASSGKR